jgi:uncharacterized SAM-binding protein YcdF (DUF218 family)
MSKSLFRPPLWLKPLKKSLNRATAFFKNALLALSLVSLGFFLGTLVLAFLLAGDLYDPSPTLSSQTHTLPDVDAIVCLTGGRGRIQMAGELWFRYLDQTLNTPPETADPPPLPILYLAGAGHQANWNTLLGRQLNHTLLQFLEPENVIIENESENTDENARWLLKFAQQRSWRRMILVTSSYHMKRSHYLIERTFRAAHVPMQIETYAVPQELFTQKNWRNDLLGIRVTLQEYLKWVYYRAFWTPNLPELRADQSS